MVLVGAYQEAVSNLHNHSETSAQRFALPMPVHELDLVAHHIAFCVQMQGPVKQVLEALTDFQQGHSDIVAAYRLPPVGSSSPETESA